MVHSVDIQRRTIDLAIDDSKPPKQ